MGDKHRDIKIMSRRDKIDDGTAKKLNLPSKEDAVLDLAGIEERRLALRLGRLDIESKTQLKHLARETREVRELMRRQHVVDSVGLSPRSSVGRLNLPPISGAPPECILPMGGKKMSTSTPPSPRLGRRISRSDSSGNVTRRRSSSTNMPVSNIMDSRKTNDFDKLVPIVRRTSSGQSLPTISTESLESPDSGDNHSGGSTPPMINIERCNSPSIKSDHPPRRLNRLELAPSSIKSKSSEYLNSNKDGYSPALPTPTFPGNVRQTKSDSNLTNVTSREKSACCLDPRFQRLTSVLVPGSCQGDEDDKANPSKETPIESNAASTRDSSQKPVRLVPIQYNAISR